MPDYTATANMLAMIRRLEDTYAGALPVNQLAEQMGVHRRTVIRWVDALESCLLDDDGHPMICREQRQRAAWAVLVGARTPVSANIFQYAATVAATCHLQVGGGSVLAESAALVVDRVEAGLPKSWRELVPQVARAFHYVPFAPKDYRDSEGVMDVLVRALIHHHPVHVRYKNHQGKVSERALHPWSMVMYRDGFYVLAKRTDASELRLYAVERFQQAELDRDGHFEVPSSFNPEQAFSRHLGLWRTDAEVERVVVAFSAQVAHALRARRWRGFVSFTSADDGRLLLTLDVPVNPEIIAWILGWGAHAEVLAPASLRSQLASELEQASARYR